MEAIVYTRSATRDGAESSLKNQEMRCIESATEAGDEVRGRIYSEVGPGNTLNREGLSALRRAVRDPEIQAVWVDDVSRLSRNMVDLVALLREFQDNGVVLNIVMGASSK